MGYLKLISEVNVVVFVADYFIEDLIGGSELSIQTHINSCPYEYIKVHSRDFKIKDFDIDKDFFVFGNFAYLSIPMLWELTKGKWQYVVEECDYKYCVYRSKHKHKAFTGAECDCDKKNGKWIRDFFLNARHLFWKSEGQRDEYYRLFPELREVPSDIMGGVFSNEDLDYIMQLRHKRDRRWFKSNKYFVLKSESWIKGYKNAVLYAREHKLSVAEVRDIPYREALNIMSKCKGIIYLPNGYDVSCRMITEAKLLGLDIRTNYLVQHMEEDWFNTGIDKMLEFLGSRDKVFWERVGGYVRSSVVAS